VRDFLSGAYNNRFEYADERRAALAAWGQKVSEMIDG
jgi:hypothetical protein